MKLACDANVSMPVSSTEDMVFGSPVSQGDEDPQKTR